MPIKNATKMEVKETSARETDGLSILSSSGLPSILCTLLSTLRIARRLDSSESDFAHTAYEERRMTIPENKLRSLPAMR